jgi:hypothetical protein
MKPIVQVPLIFGAIGGVLGALLCVGLFYIGSHPFLIDYYADYRVFLFAIFIFFVLKDIRDAKQNGILYFWQALVASLLFITFFAVVASILIGIFAFAVPDFVTSYIDQSLEVLKKLPEDVIKGIGKEVYERNLSLVPSTNYLDLMTLYFAQCYIIGILISIILSVILRRHPKT